MNNTSRPIVNNIKPIIRTQNSSCAAVFYRYANSNLTSIKTTEITNDESFQGRASAVSDSVLKSRETLILRQDIVSCSVSNDKTGIGGSFDITVKQGKEIHGGTNTDANISYTAAISTGDWVAIYMKKSAQLSNSDLASNSVNSGLKFVGIVENVRILEIDDGATGIPSLQINISGRSFGKTLDVNVFFNPAISKSIGAFLGVDLLNNSDSIAKSKSNTKTPDQMVKATLDFFMKGPGQTRSEANEQWYVPQDLGTLLKLTSSRGTAGSHVKVKQRGISVAQLLDTSRVGLHQCSGGKFNGVRPILGKNLFLSLPSSGTIWSILQYVSNQISTELYTELIPINGRLQLGVIHRQLPYSNKVGHETNAFKQAGTIDSTSNSDKTFFIDLPKLTINSTDVLQKNIGKSDHERINYILITPRISDKDYISLFSSAINTPSIQRYGLKAYQAQTPYTLGDSKESVQSMLRFTLQLLTDWFFLAHNYYNGTLVLDGVNSFVGVGDNVYIQDVKQLFHVESYTHTYQASKSGQTSYITQLKVNRGQSFDGRVATFIAGSSAKAPASVSTTFIKTRNQDGSGGKI